jgi:hypothetical protein
MDAKRFILWGSILLCAAALFAQEADVLSAAAEEMTREEIFVEERAADEYRLEEGRFLQTISWKWEENALHYVVEIEAQEGNAWNTLLQEQSSESFLEVSLSAGTYRYRVTVYDFLRRPGPVSDWIEFEIFYAWQPEINSFSPDGFYLDEDVQWELTINGENFVEGVEIYLRGGESIRPVSVSINERRTSARLVFDEQTLDVGSFEVYAVNPGGLEARLGTFRVAFRKLVDFNISAGYMPLIPLYGAVNDVWAQEFLPLGFYARAELFFFKRRWGYIGMALEPYWNYIRIETSYYTESAQLAGGALYGAYQKWFTNRTMALNFRLGGGLYTLFDYHFEYSRGGTEPITVLIPSINAGASFQWFVKKPFFIELGINYMQLLTVDTPPPGYLAPFVGGGYQF